MTDGVAYGMTHGVTYGKTHGMTHGKTHGITHGKTHGLTESSTWNDVWSDTWNDTWNNGWVARQIDATSRVERRWKQWKQSLGKFSCILYNYNPAVNSSMDIAVFSTSIFLIYSPRGTFSGF